MSLKSDIRLAKRGIKRERDEGAKKRHRPIKVPTDFVEYAEKFLRIESDGKLVPLKLNYEQRTMVQKFADQRASGEPVRAIVLKPRKIGISTCIEGLFFHDTSTNELRNTLVIADKTDSSVYIYDMSRRFYEYLPEGIRPMVRYSSRRELFFANSDEGSRMSNPGLNSRFLVEVALAGKTVLSSGEARGLTLHNVHASEVAFWTNAQATMVGVKNAVPDSPNTAIILESTPNGVGNYFHREWLRAKRGESGFLAVFFAWWQHPKYRRQPDSDFVLTETEKELQKRFELDEDQLAWRRWAIANKCDGDEELFNQEYPMDDDSCFLVSGRGVFSAESLRKMANRCTDPVWKGDFENVEDGLQLASNDRGPLHLWKHPERGRTYVIGADVAQGFVGGAFSCAQIIDRRTCEQVAVWHGHIHPDLFGERLYALGELYNWALLAPETNESGLTAVQTLLRKNYPRIYQRHSLDELEVREGRRPGWLTSRTTRPVMVDNMVAHVREGLMINDMETVGEMRSFIVGTSGIAQAQHGAYDDRIIALAIALQVRRGGLLDF